MQNQKLKVFLAASVALSFPVCMSNASGYERGAAALYMPAAHAQMPLLRGHNAVVSKLRGPYARPQYPQYRAAVNVPTMRHVPVVASGQRINYPQARPTALPVNRYAPAAPIAARPALGKTMNHHLDAVENTPPTHQRPAPQQLLTHHLDTTEAKSRIQTPITQAPRVQAYQQRPRVLTGVKPLAPHSAARSLSASSATSAQQVPSLRLSGLHQLDDARPVKLPRHVGTKQVLTQKSIPQASIPQTSAPQKYTSQKSVAVTSTPVVSTPSVQAAPTTVVSSIDQSVSKARTQSTRLAIESLRIQEAEESLVQAESQSRLRLNFDSAVGLGQFETDFNVVDRTENDTRLQRSASLNLSLPLYQGGRLKAQKDIAKTGIKSAHANFNNVASDVTQDAAIAHLNVIQNRELIKVYTNNVGLLEKQKATVQSLVRAGENTVTDEALIDARLAAIKVRLEQARARLAASESNYKKLVGRPAPALMQSTGVALPSTLAEVKALAQENNTQLKIAQAEAESAFHNIKVAKSFGRPSLSLQGVIRGAEDLSETVRRNSAAEVLLNLRVPLLSGGENKSRVRQASLAQSRATLQTRRLHEDLNESLEQLWANLKSAQRSKAPNLAQKVAAQKAYEAVIKQRNAGLATSLDVLSIEQTLIDAEINLIEAQNVEDVSRFQLLGLMGVL